MRTPEQLIWDAMKRNAPQSVWLQRIENLAVDGMPDVHVTHAFAAPDCWVELKAATLPKRPGTRVLGSRGLRQSQINWHIECCARKGRSFILIRDDNLVLYLVPGSFARSLNDAALDDIKAIGVVALSWPRVFRALACPYSWQLEARNG